MKKRQPSEYIKYLESRLDEVKKAIDFRINDNLFYQDSEINFLCKLKRQLEEKEVTNEETPLV